MHTDGQAITAAIARLEQYFGTPLFDHTVNPATLTVQGIALRAAAPQILEAVQAARDGLAAVARLAVRNACGAGTPRITRKLGGTSSLRRRRESSPASPAHLAEEGRSGQPRPGGSISRPGQRTRSRAARAKSRLPGEPSAAQPRSL